MSDEDPRVSFWSLHSSELRDECLDIADADPSAVNATLRTEARQLAIEWQEILDVQSEDVFVLSRKATQAAALRQRTIEILVHIYGND